MRPAAARWRDELGIAALLAAVAVAFVFGGWAWRLDRVVYDLGLTLWHRPPPQDIVIKAESDHTHENKGEILRCEFVGGEAFRSITLPKPIDTAKVKAEYEDGLLRITAPIAPDAQPRRIEVTTA